MYIICIYTCPSGRRILHPAYWCLGSAFFFAVILTFNFIGSALSDLKDLDIRTSTAGRTGVLGRLFSRIRV